MRTTVRAVVIKDNKLLVMDRDKYGHKFMALIGGGVEKGESPKEAVKREVREESSLEIANPRLIITLDAGIVYGRQYIYLCDYISGEPKLSKGSIEQKIAKSGQNLYTPKWLDITDLNASNLLPSELKKQLVDFCRNGFPGKPLRLTITKGSKV
jgi:ADP-ribose pyrophosphatase YjhB (NUDIX family)